MDSNTDKPGPPRPQRRPLLIAAVAAGAVVVTVAAVATHNSAPGITTPVQIGSQPAANEAPAPQQAAQPAPRPTAPQAPPQHTAAVPAQPHPKATDECFGTTPKQGSTPARPLCDWDKVFADTDARARAIRQQQNAQFEDRANELRRLPDGNH
ncbi:MAG TPA: hypothetical protein VFE65_11525 [Pseudonocardia sp.]|jgi:hypothetical protein|nr:hypothetical protein [Pseudonocardia sp.]